MQNSFTQKAYETKNYVLLNDYARLKIVHDHGGVYLDLDVELLKNIDKLLQFDFYMGFQENDNNINPGLGFGSIKHH
jgi:mannosyltransferase OCH1-like enzyme